MVYRRNYKKNGLKKRWYVNASANIPFIGKTTISAGNQKFKRAVAQVVKRSVLSPRADQIFIDTANMTHSTIQTYNLTAQITNINNGQQSRAGDKANLKYIKLKCRTIINFDTLPTNVQNCHWRMMVLKSSKEYDPSATSFGSGLGSSEIFIQPSVPEISYPDTREVTMLFDRTFTYTTEASADSGIKVFHSEISVPLNESFRYRDPDGKYGKNHNIYLVCIPFCPLGVSGTTIIGNQTIAGLIGFSSS